MRGPEDTGRARGLCVGLFAEDDGAQVAIRLTGYKGEFEFTNIYPGEYRLIAASKAFGELNIPIEVGQALATVAEGKRLLLHMRMKTDWYYRSWASLIPLKEYFEREGVPE